LVTACGSDDNVGSKDDARPFTAPAADSPPDEAIQSFTDQGVFPGLAVGVIVAGETAYAKIAGIRKQGDSAPIEANDAFHIGSDTKAMTALLAGMMVDEGKLRWDSSLAEVLGGTLTVPATYAAISLTQLLSHTSGIPDELPQQEELSFFGTSAPVSDERRRMVKLTLEQKPVSEAGTQYLYSNFNYVIVGLMLEVVSKLSWEDLITTRLFSPVGMPSAGFGSPASPGLVDAPWGHNPEPVSPSDTYADNPPAIGPAGTVHINLADALKYLQVYLNDGVADTGRIISSESLQAIESPWASIDRSTSYGFGWGVFQDAAGDRVLKHDGSNMKFYTSIVMVPAKRTALVIMTNIGSPPTPTRVQQLVHYLLGHFVPDVVI
jgi:CubicO group peptidase (beta-lactamase class C family)